MPDSFDPDDGITRTHPSGHLRPAPNLVLGELDQANDAGGPGRLDLAAWPAGAGLSTEVVAYGPGIVDETTLRLLGHPDGKRVLVLGVGDGQAVVALARQGARVIGVDPSASDLEATRARCDDEGVKAELHHGDLAELAFVRADTIDLVLSAYALAGMDDLNRVFRQAHRVLRPEAPLVASLPHPANAVAEGGSYFDRTPRPWAAGDAHGTAHPRTISDVFTSLTRANFRVDTLLEPEPGAPSGAYDRPSMALAPTTLVIRAKKEGI